jgi:hypothetical protein
MTRPPGEPRWNLPRVLFIAGVAVAIIAIVSWVTVDTNGGGSDNASGCHVPAHAKAGTQPLPPLIATLATPLGSPDASFTEDSGGVTVYGYCFDVVDGSAVASTVDQLRQLDYAVTPGQNPTEQLNFAAKNESPAAVSVSVGGDLDVSHPVAGTKGALSIVWTDSDVSD